jgi:hypothetical protein
MLLPVPMLLEPDVPLPLVPLPVEPLVPPAPEVDEPWRSRQSWRSVPVRPAHWLALPPALDALPPLAPVLLPLDVPPVLPLDIPPVPELPIELPLEVPPLELPIEPLVPVLPPVPRPLDELPVDEPPLALLPPAEPAPPAPPAWPYAIVPMLSSAAATAATRVLLFMKRLLNWLKGNCPSRARKGNAKRGGGADAATPLRDGAHAAKPGATDRADPRPLIPGDRDATARNGLALRRSRQ